MIKISFSIINPWSDKFDAGYSWYGKLTKNKAWEVQFYRSNTIAEALAELTHRQDHAGLGLELGLLSFNLTFKLYDSRHWNYATKSWETYDDKENLL